MKPRHTISYDWRGVRQACKPATDPWYKLKGLVEPLGWRLEGEVLQRFSSPPICHFHPGHILSFGEEAPSVDADNRLFVALFKFVGGSMVRVTSTASLLEFDQTCSHLQESLGLPIDPFFVLERTLYELESPTERLWVEVPVDLNPESLLAHLGPAYKIKRMSPVVPEGSQPSLYKGLWVYRSAIPARPAPRRPDPPAPRQPDPPAPRRKATHNKGMEFKQGEHFRNMLTGEIWVSDLQYPVPTGPGWDDHPFLPAYLKQREEHAPTALEEARLVGKLFASILAHVRRYRDEVYTSLLQVHLYSALTYAAMEPRVPFKYNWRLPVYEPAEAPTVERFCQRYEVSFPPNSIALGNAASKAYRWGMGWIGAYTWRRLMFESMAEHTEVGAYFLQRWNESKDVL